MKNFPPSASVRCALHGVALLALSTAAVFAVEAKKMKVGFAQTGAESDWRTANTESIKAEAAKRGVDLKFSDAQGKQENQIKAVRSFITQGVDVIMISPIVETGWEPVLREAKKARIPVVLSDRSIQTSDDSLYVTFVGSDFYKEGQMAGDWLAKAVNGKGNIVELQGTPGSAPANERRKSFGDAIAKHPGLKVIDSISGNFELSMGKQVMEAFLKKHGRNINIVYAHNDSMALGAIQAIKEAGLKPGKDLVIVSIDAMRPAVQAVADGTLNCTVECNPLFGPIVFDVAARIVAGEKVPKKLLNTDIVIDATNAAQLLPTRKY
jgi:galactofuranose transport system substrate-binding protein